MQVSAVLARRVRAAASSTLLPSSPRPTPCRQIADRSTPSCPEQAVSRMLALPPTHTDAANPLVLTPTTNTHTHTH
ncbi:hypothetical protein T492DRAFT_1032989 [Pavlovales sp. CCMP2436]|nr:hypothetical protein T492DRAFT_1032989 [Pavlovales sp. CCMP2436]